MISNPIILLLLVVLGLGIGYKLIQEISYFMYKVQSDGEVSREEYQKNNLKDQILQDC